MATTPSSISWGGVPTGNWIGPWSGSPGGTVPGSWNNGWNTGATSGPWNNGGTGGSWNTGGTGGTTPGAWNGGWSGSWNGGGNAWSAVTPSSWSGVTWTFWTAQPMIYATYTSPSWITMDPYNLLSFSPTVFPYDFTTEYSDFQCSAGFNVASFYPSTGGEAYSVIFPEMRFKCSGVLKTWTVYVKAAEAPFYLGVFRETRQRGVYTLVGSNFIVPYSGYGRQEYEIEPAKQIGVMAGDIVGYFYETRRIQPDIIGVGFATDNSGDEMTISYVHGYTSPDFLPVDTSKKIQFGNMITSTRIAPFNGLVETREVCHPTIKIYGTEPSIPAGSVVPYGTEIIYKCVRNTQLVDGSSNILKCVDGGAWLEPLPTCGHIYPPGKVFL